MSLLNRGKDNMLLDDAILHCCFSKIFSLSQSQILCLHLCSFSPQNGILYTLLYFTQVQRSCELITYGWLVNFDNTFREYCHKYFSLAITQLTNLIYSSYQQQSLVRQNTWSPIQCYMMIFIEQTINMIDSSFINKVIKKTTILKRLKLCVEFIEQDQKIQLNLSELPRTAWEVVLQINESISIFNLFLNLQPSSQPLSCSVVCIKNLHYHLDSRRRGYTRSQPSTLTYVSALKGLLL